MNNQEHKYETRENPLTALRDRLEQETDRLLKEVGETAGEMGEKLRAFSQQVFSEPERRKAVGLAVCGGIVALEALFNPIVALPVQAAEIDAPWETPAVLYIQNPENDLTYDSGYLTVYADTLWEQEYYNRVGYTPPDYHFTFPSPMINPEIARQSSLMELLKNNRVIAVNPMAVSDDYERIMEGVRREAQAGSLTENQVLQLLSKKSEELTEIVYEDVLGRVVDIVAPDGTRYPVVILSVFSVEHAAEYAGIVSRKSVSGGSFVGDVHNAFMSEAFGITFDPKTGWKKNKDGSAPTMAELPLIRICPTNMPGVKSPEFKTEPYAQRFGGFIKE